MRPPTQRGKGLRGEGEVERDQTAGEYKLPKLSKQSKHKYPVLKICVEIVENYTSFIFVKSNNI